MTRKMDFNTFIVILSTEAEAERGRVSDTGREDGAGQHPGSVAMSSNKMTSRSV